MLLRAIVMKLVALAAFCCVSAFAQTLSHEGETHGRAAFVSNTAYTKLPPTPVDDSGPNALADALRSVHFDVQVHQNLTLDGLIKVLDEFQSSVKPGEVTFLYYSGYVVQDLDYNYLVPIEFDPALKRDMGDSAYLFPRLLKGLAENNSSLNMIVLDASWNTPQLTGRAGLAQPNPPPRTWIFASTGPNQFSTQMIGKTGLFTDALVKALRQPGLDLTDLVTKVTGDVETASKGTQHPQAWSTGVPRFYFLAPVPIGVEKQNGNDRLKYVYIPAGRFWMGCAPASEAECSPEEKPRHQVDLTKAYWLGQTEVTNQAYQRFADANKIKWKPKRQNTDAGKQGDIPVVHVSWDDAQKYCRWAGKGGRLPTEAEWERAARGGTDDAVYPFSDLATSREKANFLGTAGADRFEDFAPVAQFDPNAYDLYDMAGNVWEWTLDWFSATYYRVSAKESPVRDPEGPTSPDKGQNHVIRGGSWASDAAKHLRISYRESGELSGGNLVGFRCLLPDSPEVNAGFRN